MGTGSRHPKCERERERESDRKKKEVREKDTADGRAYIGEGKGKESLVGWLVGFLVTYTSLRLGPHYLGCYIDPAFSGINYHVSTGKRSDAT